MPTKINPDYTPNDRVYELMANRYGMTKDQAREFIGHELEEFKMYWLDTEKTKANWNTTCLNWMKRQYENKKEAMARNRSYSGLQGNIFDKVLDKLDVTTAENPAPPSSPVQAYVHPVQPQPQETISTDEALEWMRQFGRIRMDNRR